GESIEAKIVEKSGKYIRLELDLELKNGGDLIVNHIGGIEILPLVPKPKPGNSSRGFRILKHELIDEEYILTFEGNRGNTESFELYCPDWQLTSVDGAELINLEGEIYSYRMVFDPGKGYQIKKIRVQLNRQKR
ncbi:MAG: hypothetical protein DRI71_08005, partial [Bacteroidetes bacterium]